MIKEVLLDWLKIRKRWNLTIAEKAGMYYDDHRNFYLQKYQLVIFRVSKVAGTSLWKKSAELIGHQDVTRDSLPKLNVPKVAGLEIADRHDLYKAGFVRNPWDRLLSCYLQKKAYNRKKFYERNNFDPKITFEEFVMKVCSIHDGLADQHFRSQFMTLMNHQGEFIVDFIGQFERMNEDFNSLAHQVGIPIPHGNLSKTNRTEHEPYVNYYTSKMQKAVAERYEIDLALFKYKFDEKEIPDLANVINESVSKKVKHEILVAKCAKMIQIISRIQMEERAKRFGIKQRFRHCLFERNKLEKRGVLEPYDDHRNIFIQDQNLLIYKVPKNASSSLWHLAAELLGHKVQKQDLRNIMLPYLPFYEIDRDRHLYKIGFVRNPWDRVVSCFLQKKKYKRERFFEKLNIPMDVSFSDFVEVVCNTPDEEIEGHLRSQFTYFIDHTGAWVVNFLGRFEHFNDDLKTVFESRNIGLQNIPHWNESGNNNYQSYYTPVLSEKIAQRYAIDIELFDYEFGQPPVLQGRRDLISVIDDDTKLKILSYKSKKLMKVLREMNGYNGVDFD